MFCKTLKSIRLNKRCFSMTFNRLGAESKALREKFLEDKAKTSYNYLGVNIASSKIPEVDSLAKEFTEKFYIPQDLAPNFSETTRDVLARIHLNLHSLQLGNWTTLGMEDGQEELYDEYEASKKQAKKVLSTITDDAEKSAINKAVNELVHVWDLALKVERISTYLDGLKNKYHNQYVSTKYDGHIFKELVEQVLKLKKEAHGEVANRNIQELMDQIVYLEGKVIIPELKTEYPTLFK